MMEAALKAALQAGTKSLIGREIDYIVLHCTGGTKDATVQNILDYWKNKMGWKNPGYHFLIDDDGQVHNLQPLNKLANGVKGYNSKSIHISYIGGKHTDDRSEHQYTAMEALVKTLHSVFPQATIQGHCDFPGVTKSCPRFDVAEFLQEIEL